MLHNKLHITVVFWLLLVLILGLAAVTRFYRLDSLPPALYWEEVALGFDAYSVWQTGRDIHDHPWPVVAFESFGDWKPSGYFYAVMPAVGLLGLTEWAVRIPAALSGLFLVAGMGMLAWQWWRSRVLVLIAVAVASVSPWAIMFSRAAWESMLATTLLLWGVICFNQVFRSLSQASSKSSSRSLSQSPKLATRRQFFWLLFWSMLAVILVAASTYTYHAARLIAPSLLLLLMVVAAFQARFKFGQLAPIVVSGFVFILLLTPLLKSFSGLEVQSRFTETSIFTDISLIEKSNQLNQDWVDWGVLGWFLSHRFVIFGNEIIKNISAHLDPNFLFITGDGNPRHSTKIAGQLYLFEAFFVALGLVYIWRKWRFWSVILMGWLFISLIPASLTVAIPHGLRILPGLPVWLIIVALGIWQFLKWDYIRTSLWRSSIVVSLLLACYIFFFAQFWTFYTTIYPYTEAGHWQYGYKEMVGSLAKLEETNPDLPVYITREQGRPLMYYWLYNQVEPQLVQQAERVAKNHKGTFYRADGQSITSIDDVGEVESLPALVAASPDFHQSLLGQPQVVIHPDYEPALIHDPQGKVVWQVQVVESVGKQ